MGMTWKPRASNGERVTVMHQPDEGAEVREVTNYIHCVSSCCVHAHVNTNSQMMAFTVSGNLASVPGRGRESSRGRPPFLYCRALPLFRERFFRYRRTSESEKWGPYSCCRRRRRARRCWRAAAASCCSKLALSSKTPGEVFAIVSSDEDVYVHMWYGFCKWNSQQLRCGATAAAQQRIWQ